VQAGRQAPVGRERSERVAGHELDLAGRRLAVAGEELALGPRRGPVGRVSRLRGAAGLVGPALFGVAAGVIGRDARVELGARRGQLGGVVPQPASRFLDRDPRGVGTVARRDRVAEHVAFLAHRDLEVRRRRGAGRLGGERAVEVGGNGAVP
jgi:hypothetical protein